MHWRKITGATSIPVGISADAAAVASKMQAEATRVGLAHLGPFALESRTCGLVEAPVGQGQTALRPGCRLRVRVAGGTPETDRSVTVALEPKRTTDTLYGP